MISNLKNRFAVITLFFCVFAHLLPAQSLSLTQTIRGTVIDKQSQSPLPGVIVQIIRAPTAMATTTDADGSFRIVNVPIGRRELRFALLGYSEKFQTVILDAGKEAVLKIEMEENAFNADEVVVVAEQDKTATNNKMATVSARVFSAEEAARYAGSRNDPARMAANFAGVSGANDSRNDIVIRGNSPLGVLWRLNGVDIPNPNHFGNSGSTGGPVSILNNNTLGNSDFMTSAFPADYGNATAGVFDLKMREGNNEKYEFLGQVGFNGFELGAEGPFKKGKPASFLVNYRYSTLSVFKALNIDFGTGAAIPQYQDMNFKVDLPTKKAGRFSVWGLGGLSYVAILESDKKEGQALYGFSARDVYFRSNVGASGISHTYLLKHNDYIRTNFGFSSSINLIQSDRIDSSFKTPGNIKPEYRQTAINNKYSFNSTYHKKMNSRDFFSTGVYVDLLQSTFIDSNDAQFGYNTFVTLRDYKGTSALLRGFVQWQHKFNEKWVTTVGVSNQYLALNHANAIEPRAGLKYQLTKKHALSIGGGLHSQLQPLYIYFASTTQNGERLETNKQLDFTRAAHSAMAWDMNLGAFRIKSELYYQYLYRVPVRNYSDPFSILNLGADFTSPNIANLVNSGNGRNYGLELTVEKFYSKGYYVLFTSSLFQSKYQASDKVWRNTAFNGNHVSNLLAGKEFKIGKNSVLSLDVRATYAGGKCYTPIDLDASKLANNEVRDASQAFSKRYPDYFRIDVKPGYKWNQKRVTHEWSIDIQNITRHENVFQQSYDIVSKTIKTDYQLKFFVIPQYRMLF